MSTAKASETQTESNKDPNSDAAFGERMRYRLEDMLAHPYTFLPSYETRYKTLLKYAQSLTPHQAYAMTMLLGKDAARLYPDMPDTAELQFPRVNAVDVRSQVGWYYFAGTCFGEDGIEYGILCMLFRYSLLPSVTAQEFGLTDVENQIVDLQLAVSVGGGPYYQVEPVVTAGTSGNVRVADKLCLVADNCSVESLNETPFPLRLQAHGTDRGGEQPVDIAIDFNFTSGRNYLLQGLDGAEPLVAGVGTRYYSIPGIVLDAATSSLTVDSKPIALKGGTFWFDHQWGLGMTPSGSPRHESLRAMANIGPQSPPGWDFFVANFDGDYSMTLNSGHTAASLKYLHQTGDHPPDTNPPSDVIDQMVVPVVGKYLDPYGTTFNISGQLKVTKWLKTKHSPNPERYPNVGTWVPHGWEFTITEKVVPERLRSFRMEAITDEAQALFFSQGAQYVESANTLFDADNKRAGVGYAEAVGYVDSMPVVLGLAGLPATKEMQALFRVEPPSPEMVALSFLYMLQPAAQQEFNRLKNCGSFPPGPRPLNCAEAAQALSDSKPLETQEITALLLKFLGERNVDSLQLT